MGGADLPRARAHGLDGPEHRQAPDPALVEPGGRGCPDDIVSG